MRMYSHLRVGGQTVESRVGKHDTKFTQVYNWSEVPLLHSGSLQTGACLEKTYHCARGERRHGGR
jgi:hypothetical protein